MPAKANPYGKREGVMTTRHVVTDVSDYVRLISELDVPGAGQFPIRPVLFRGQFADRSLLPKVSRFGGRSWTLAHEQFALRDFRRQAMPLVPPVARPENDLEWLTVAQHHGMATRLLDWTDSPFVALWFALNWPDDRRDQEVEPIIWALIPEPRDIIIDTACWLDDPLEVETTHVVCPRHTGGRIRAQAGWFTLHHRLPSGDFPALNEQKHYQGMLRRIRISPLAQAGGKMRRQLLRCGISAGMLFPDLGGICETINQQVEFSL